VGRSRCLGWNKASQKTARVKSRKAGEESQGSEFRNKRRRLRQCLTRFGVGCTIRQGAKDRERGTGMQLVERNGKYWQSMLFSLSAGRVVSLPGQFLLQNTALRFLEPT